MYDQLESNDRKFHSISIKTDAGKSTIPSFFDSFCRKINYTHPMVWPPLYKIKYNLEIIDGSLGALAPLSPFCAVVLVIFFQRFQAQNVPFSDHSNVNFDFTELFVHSIIVIL